MGISIAVAGRLRGLPPAWQRLVRVLQRVNFGRVAFPTARGEPDTRVPWRIRRTLKLAAPANGVRPETDTADFALCQAQRAMLAQLAGVQPGARVTIEVKHGLPFLIEIEEHHRVA